MKTTILENLWLLIKWNQDLSSDPTVILLDIYMEKCVYMQLKRPISEIPHQLYI